MEENNDIFHAGHSNIEYRIHWNINIRKKIIYEKINDSVVWNKHFWEQY